MGEAAASSVIVVEYRGPGVCRTRRVRSFGEEVSKLAALATVFVHYGLRMPREKGADGFFFAGLLVWLGIGVAIAARRWCSVSHPSQRRATAMGWRVAIGLLLVATLSSFVVPLHARGRYTCPHGMRWANNQLGIAWSDNGGPCGNGPNHRVGSAWRVAESWYVYRPRAW